MNNQGQGVKLTNDEREGCLKCMTLIGRALWSAGAYRAFKDGDGVSAVWRWWHPLSWIMWAALLPICGVVGERIADQVPFRLNDYWRQRKDKIQWL